MIRCVFEKEGGRKVAVIGMTLATVQRMLEGNPVHIRGEDMALPPLDLVVMYGQSQKELIDTLRLAGLPITDEMAAAALEGPGLLPAPADPSARPERSS